MGPFDKQEDNMSVEERYEMALRDLESYANKINTILLITSIIEQDVKEYRGDLVLERTKQIKKIIMGKWAE